MNRYYRQIDYSKFDTNMEEFINENNITSDTDYIIITSTKDKLTYILKKRMIGLRYFILGVLL